MEIISFKLMNGGNSMHGAAGGDDAGGFPAQGTGVDQFSGDADGDFFGGYSFDRGANGGMNLGDCFVRNTPFPELGIDGSCFLPGTDNTNIGKISPQNLILNFQIEAVTVGHDDDVILSGKLQIIRNSGVITQNNLLCWIEETNSKMGLPDKFDVVKDEDIDQMITWAKKEANPLYPVPVVWGRKDFRRLIASIRK